MNNKNNELNIDYLVSNAIDIINKINPTNKVNNIPVNNTPVNNTNNLYNLISNSIDISNKLTQPKNNNQIIQILENIKRDIKPELDLRKILDSATGIIGKLSNKPSTIVPANIHTDIDEPGKETDLRKILDSATGIVNQLSNGPIPIVPTNTDGDIGIGIGKESGKETDLRKILDSASGIIGNKPSTSVPKEDNELTIPPVGMFSSFTIPNIIPDLSMKPFDSDKYLKKLHITDSSYFIDISNNSNNIKDTTTCIELDDTTNELKKCNETEATIS
jgi:hypothetical protein